MFKLTEIIVGVFLVIIVGISATLITLTGKCMNASINMLYITLII